MIDMPHREQMNIVIAGHVDHGKSSVIGRLLADSNSLPIGKLEQVKESCRRNSKPFEYAFLLDALKDEQAQGITIDSARCFFKTRQREYIIIDAPGHVEFLKNMISGAARAEAAILVIDANEGVQENSRRHGYMLSLLGIKQIIVCINKMDLVNYQKSVYDAIVDEYQSFLSKINVNAKNFIPLSARNGDNIASLSPKTAWFQGNALIDEMDLFEKEKPDFHKPFRLPVQGVYKFTEHKDDRRIIAGKIESGAISVGDEVIFLPSGKKSRISSIEMFNAPFKSTAVSGECPGFTLETQIYVKPGEIMCKISEPFPKMTSLFRVNIFWMSPKPMITNKQYKLKIGTMSIPVFLTELKNTLDASDLSSDRNKQQIDRHEVAECVIKTSKPIAADLVSDIAHTSRFVIVDDYRISGGGIILQTIEQKSNLYHANTTHSKLSWEKSLISSQTRADRNAHQAMLIIILGELEIFNNIVARELEKFLFNSQMAVYYLGVSDNHLLNNSDSISTDERAEYLRRFAEIAQVFTHSGMILISTISNLNDYELDMIMKMNAPADMFVVSIGNSGIDSEKIDLEFPSHIDPSRAVFKITDFLRRSSLLLEYQLPTFRRMSSDTTISRSE